MDTVDSSPLDISKIMWLVAGNILFFILWVASEIIGESRCRSNGVLSFVISGMGCMGGQDIHLDITIGDRETTPLVT